MDSITINKRSRVEEGDLYMSFLCREGDKQTRSFYGLSPEYQISECRERSLSLIGMKGVIIERLRLLPYFPPALGVFLLAAISELMSCSACAARVIVSSGNCREAVSFTRTTCPSLHASAQSQRASLPEFGVIIPARMAALTHAPIALAGFFVRRTSVVGNETPLVMSSPLSCSKTESA
jgi:hypothetical protein